MAKKETTSGFIYLWRDSKRNRYYVGCHWGTPDDGYVCSSRWMRKSYNRRPQDFRRRILETVTTSRADLFVREAAWLGLIKDEELGKRYYNFKKNIHNILEYTPEMREKMAAANRGKKPSAETLAKRSTALKAALGTPENKQRASEHAKKIWSDPDHAEKMSSSMKQSWQENREARIEALTEAANRPEVKEKISKASKERWQDPAYREDFTTKHKGKTLRQHTPEEVEANRQRQLQLCQDPAHLKKMSAAQLNSEKASTQSKINIQKTRTPEAIAKMAEAKKQRHAERMKDPVAYEAFKEKCRQAAAKRWSRAPSK